MTCPHCGVTIHDQPRRTAIEQNSIGQTYFIEDQVCPACGGMILVLGLGRIAFTPSGQVSSVVHDRPRRIIEPVAPSRPVPPEVPTDLRRDYQEAAATLEISPLASAALSRRCLQNTIRQRTGIVERSLEKEIDAVIGAGLVSTGLADQLHAVRVVGNFAAHPLKDATTGQLVDVEAGEAEWNLDVLDGLFDELCVAPAQFASRKAGLNAKLRAAGKPELP